MAGFAHPLQRTAAIFCVICCALQSACVFMPTDAQLGQSEESLGPRSLAPSPDAPRLASLATRYFDAVTPDQEILGAMQVLFARDENTFVTIARAHNLGYDELRAANPNVDVWLPGEGTPIYLPTMVIVPDAPRDGIVLNLPSMRLLHFAASESEPVGDQPLLSVTSHPIGIGREGWATPTGQTRVIEKAAEPTWYPPASVRAEHEALGDPLPSVVPPGPDNPLGHFALRLSMPGYLIHGTNKPAGVGMRVSHGCIRLYPEDIEALYDRVPREMPVYIVDQPVLAGWHDGVLYLEAHAQLAEDERDLAEEAQHVVADALERAGVSDAVVDAEAIARIISEQRGIPFPVFGTDRGLDAYLADSRIIENTVPAFVSETADDPPPDETTASRN